MQNASENQNFNDILVEIISAYPHKEDLKLRPELALFLLLDQTYHLNIQDDANKRSLFSEILNMYKSYRDDKPNSKRRTTGLAFHGSIEFNEELVCQTKIRVYNLMERLFNSELAYGAFSLIDKIESTPRYESQYRSHRGRDIEKDGLNPIIIGMGLVKSSAEKIKTALPNNVRDRIDDSKLLQLAFTMTSGHEMMHGLDDYLLIMSGSNELKSSPTLEAVKRTDFRRYPFLVNSIWDLFVHREHLARAFEQQIGKEFLIDEMKLTEDEYQRFYTNYYKPSEELAKAYERFLEYSIPNPSSEFDIERFGNLIYDARWYNRGYSNLSSMFTTVLAYAATPYSIGQLKELVNTP